MKHTMVRCGITTLKSFKQAIQDLPDDYLIGTNAVGNITIYRKEEDKLIEPIGYIELMNLEFIGTVDEIYDCELTRFGK